MSPEMLIVSGIVALAATYLTVRLLRSAARTAKGGECGQGCGCSLTQDKSHVSQIDPGR